MIRNELLDEVKAELIASGMDPFHAIGATVRVVDLVQAWVRDE